MRKLVDLDDDTSIALMTLCQQRKTTVQSLFDEAISDLLAKYRMPRGLHEALKMSAKGPRSIQVNVPAERRALPRR